jgi:hypothetical protein
MQNYREYQLCRQITLYLKLQYPKAIFHFDYAGLYHTKSQAGLMAAIQGDRGFPDLVIYEKRGGFGALALEIKAEGTKLYKRNGEPVSDHIREQRDCLLQLHLRGYQAGFAIGFDNAQQVIYEYMRGQK